MFMEEMTTVLAKTLFPRKSVSLLSDPSTTCSLVSFFRILVGLEMRIRLLLSACSNPNLELFPTPRKMKHFVLFTTQDIFFMNYYLKIAHIQQNSDECS